jgi:hypothetical protein
MLTNESDTSSVVSGDVHDARARETSMSGLLAQR